MRPSSQKLANRSSGLIANVMKTAVKKSYTEWQVNGDADSRDCHAENVTSFQRLKRQKKSQYADNMINAQISKAESSVRHFWKVWKTRSTNASVMQVVADVWFEHFTKLFYNERALPSLPELGEREVSGLTDEISIDEVNAATRHYSVVLLYRAKAIFLVVCLSCVQCRSVVTPSLISSCVGIWKCSLFTTLLSSLGSIHNLICPLSFSAITSEFTQSLGSVTFAKNPCCT